MENSKVIEYYKSNSNNVLKKENSMSMKMVIKMIYVCKKTINLMDIVVFIMKMDKLKIHYII